MSKVSQLYWMILKFLSNLLLVSVQDAGLPRGLRTHTRPPASEVSRQLFRSLSLGWFECILKYYDTEKIREVERAVGSVIKMKC